MPEPIRVTSVLSYFKEPWYVDWVCRVGKREANRIGKQAMKIGTAVDEIIKNDPLGTFESFDHKLGEVNNCLKAFVKWRDIYKPKFIEHGTRLFATIHGQDITGEPDLFVDDVLVDIKCSTKISPSYWIQVNMYHKLSDSPFSTKVGILRLDKHSGSYEYVVKNHEPLLCDVWVGLMLAMVYFKGDEHDGVEL